MWVLHGRPGSSCCPGAVAAAASAADGQRQGERSDENASQGVRSRFVEPGRTEATLKEGMSMVCDRAMLRGQSVAGAYARVTGCGLGQVVTRRHG